MKQPVLAFSNFAEGRKKPIRQFYVRKYLLFVLRTLQNTSIQPVCRMKDILMVNIPVYKEITRLWCWHKSRWQIWLPLYLKGLNNSSKNYVSPHLQDVICAELCVVWIRSHLRMQSGNLLQIECSKSIVISVRARLENVASEARGGFPPR